MKTALSLVLLVAALACPIRVLADSEASAKRLTGQEVLERVQKLRGGNSDTAVRVEREEPNSAWVLVRGLGITFGMLGLVVLGLKKMKPDAAVTVSRSVKILERVAVSHKVQLLVVEFDGRRMLLGLGGDTIRPISTELNPTELGMLAGDDENRFAA